MKKNLLLLAFILICLISCQRDPVKILTRKDWRMISWTVSPAYMGNTDLFTLLPPCQQDDYLTFEDEGILITHEGASKCNETDPQTLSSGWHINDEQTELSFYTDTTYTTYQIKKVNANNLQLETTFEEDVDGNGTTTQFTHFVTYKAL